MLVALLCWTRWWEVSVRLFLMSRRLTSGAVPLWRLSSALARDSMSCLCCTSLPGLVRVLRLGFFLEGCWLLSTASGSDCGLHFLLLGWCASLLLAAFWYYRPSFAPFSAVFAHSTLLSEPWWMLCFWQWPWAAFFCACLSGAAWLVCGLAPRCLLGPAAVACTFSAVFSHSTLLSEPWWMPSSRALRRRLNHGPSRDEQVDVLHLTI